MSSRRDRCWIGMALVTCALTAHGADRPPAKSAAKPPAPELDFLEYLGTLEGDEENWTEIATMELPHMIDTQGIDAQKVDAKGKASASSAARASGAAKGNAKPEEAAVKSAGSEK